jgi:PAS domain S-box-containing protein
MPLRNFRKPVFIGLGMFLVLTVLTQLLVYFWYQSARYTEIQRLSNQANAKKERVHITLTNSLSCTRTLAFVVEEHGIPQDFNRIAEKLLRANPLVDAIELLEGGVITHVYPVNGNEAAIGYNILSDTVRHRGAVIAMQRKDFFFAGPVKLKQGGIAVIGRQPIFINGKFWGFAAVLIKLSSFMKATAIDADSNRDFSYQLSRVRTNGQEEFFLPAAAIPTEGDFVTIEVPNTEWKLYVTSRNQTEIYHHAIVLSALGFLFSSIVGIFSWYTAYQPEKLEQLVERRTCQLTMEKELSDSIINSLPGIIYIYDQNRKFFRWNRNFESVSGYTSDEVRNMHPLDFFEGEDKELLRKKIETVFDKGQADVEAYFYTRTKEKIIYYFNGNVAHFDGNTYLIGMGIDISKRAAAEKDIQDLNTRLQATIERLQARNNDLQQFSYVVSHNLRNPIARILGLASIFGDDTNENRVIVDKITEATTQLDDTVKDISTIVSARNITEKYEYVSFNDAWENVRHELKNEIDQSHVAISVDFNKAPGLISVKSYIHNMLYNLVSNALKFRNQNIPATISIKTNLYKQGICLEVQDNGIGIDLVKNGAKLFGLYKRFGPESIPGKGIGLCLTKNQVESLHGKIEVASKLQEGSTFTIYLPTLI